MAHKLRNQVQPSSHPLEDHPKYVRAIGMVSLEAIAMELRLALLFARVMGIPLRTAQAIYLTPKAEQTRFDIFKNAVHAHLAVSPTKKNSVLGKQKTKALKDVLSIISRAEKLIRQRHRVIHDEWNYSDTEKKVTRKLIDGHPGRERTPIKKKDLDILIESMRVIIDDAYDLAKAYSEHPPFMVSLKLNSNDVN